MVKYRYGMIVDSMELTAGLADLTSREMLDEIGVGLQTSPRKLSEAIQTLPPGDWKVISHDVVRIDRHLIVTYLLRRPE